MELTPRDLAVIIWFNTHSEWSKEVAIDWLEGFLELHLEEAVMRGECKVLGKGSLTPSHDAKDGKVSASPIASSEMPIAIEPPHVVDEA